MPHDLMAPDPLGHLEANHTPLSTGCPRRPNKGSSWDDAPSPDLGGMHCGFLLHGTAWLELCGGVCVCQGFDVHAFIWSGLMISWLKDVRRGLFTGVRFGARSHAICAWTCSISSAYIQHMSVLYTWAGYGKISAYTPCPWANYKRRLTEYDIWVFPR